MTISSMLNRKNGLRMEFFLFEQNGNDAGTKWENLKSQAKSTRFFALHNRVMVQREKSIVQREKWVKMNENSDPKFRRSGSD